MNGQPREVKYRSQRESGERLGYLLQFILSEDILVAVIERQDGSIITTGAELVNFTEPTYVRYGSFGDAVYETVFSREEKIKGMKNG